MTPSHTCTEPGCGKSFSSASHLRRHARNHRGERAFVCRECGQSFVRREVWTRHERLHFNPKSDKPRVKVISRPSAVSSDTRTEVTPDQSTASQTARTLSSPVMASGYASFARPDDPPYQLISGRRHTYPAIAPLSAPNEASTSASTSIVPAPPSDIIWPEPASLTGTLPFQLGIEAWLDEILNDQAALTVQPTLQWHSDPALSPSVLSASDNDAHARLRAWLVENAPTIASDLTPERAHRALTAYWTLVHPEFPIIHRPTWDPARAPGLLLLALVLKGATLAEEGDALWAESAFPTAAGLALSSTPKSPRGRLHTLQSLLLLSLTGHGLPASAQDTAAAMLSSALTLARRYNLYEDRCPFVPRADVHSQWRQWALEEATRRVAWAILMRDIEYATLFSQLPSRAMTPFRLPVDLPCREVVWEASGAEEWNTLCASSGGETLAAALKRVLSEPASMGRGERGREFAHLVLVCALCALGWDVNRRDLVAPEVSKAGPGLNTFLLRTFSVLALDRKERSPVVLQGCIRDIGVLAALDLHLNFLHLQVFAGVGEIGTLQPVRPSDWIEADKSMRRWAADGSGTALAAEYLSIVLHDLAVPTLNRAWAMYMAFLVCWSYYAIMHRLPPSPTVTPSEEGALQACDALADWSRGGREPPSHYMSALTTLVVQRLGQRHEVLIKGARALIDRNATQFQSGVDMISPMSSAR